MAGKTEKVIISRGGIARGIHGPLVAAVTKKLGDPQIMRASHVEPGSELSQAALVVLYNDDNHADRIIPLLPDPESGIVPLPGCAVVYRPGREYATKWFADLSPVAPNVILGPYDTRDEALAEEVKWLHINNIPVCESCRAGGGT